MIKLISMKSKWLIGMIVFSQISLSYAQDIITGRVTSADDGEGLPGATVRIKDSNNGTITDYDGNFSLSADQGAVLVITYIGFITQEETVGSESSVDIKLMPDIETLDEVIVVGYGTQKKSDITGAVASIRKADMNPGPVVSVSNLMQSTAPGVVLTQSSAQPGGGFDVKIRGAGSPLSSNSPLYVVDGLPIGSDNVQPGSLSRYRSSPPRNPLNGINPQDIVAIEILKDASATAIYGARGANGVVLITTKRGSSGKLSLDYSSSFSIQQLTKDYDMLKANEYMRVSNEVFLQNNPDRDPLFSAAEINRAGDGTDWIAEITRLGTIHQQQVGASGSAKNFKYYLSANYYNHKGIVDVSELERLGGRANIDYTKNKFEAGINLTYTHTNDQQVPFGASSNAPEFGGLFDNTRIWAPNLPVRDENGEYTVHPTRELVPNPVSLLEIDDQTTTNRLLGSTYLSYEIASGLKARFDLGRDQSNSDREAFIPLSVVRGAQANGEGEVGTIKTLNSLARFTLTYDKEIGKNQLTVLAGTDFQQFDSEGSSSLFTDFADQSTDFSKVTNADTSGVVMFKEQSRLISYLGRINYSLDDRFLFTVSFRADGSTRFGADHKWGYFPSGAFAWKIHNESFFNSSLINQLKIRVGYGTIGNQEIGNKLSQSVYNVTRRTVLGGVPIRGLSPLRPDNPSLKWEATTQLNVGIDFALWESRLYGSVDVYDKVTSDIILFYGLSATAGFPGLNTNALDGKVGNRGIEFGLTSRNMVKSLEWTTSVNFAINKNEWRNRAGFYPEGETIALENGPLNGIYGYKVLGLFQTQAEIDGSPDQSSVFQPVIPGSYKYADANGDGEITTDDRVLLGNTDPDLTIGLNNTFAYKKFDLNFFFTGMFGREKLNYTRANLEDVDGMVDFYFNRSREVLNRWSEDNTSATIPGSDGLPGGFGGNSMYIEDASFVRLRNVTLGYTIGDLGVISNFRIYADAQNLLTITSFKGPDPETDEFSQYPLAKTFTMGLSATF